MEQRTLDVLDEVEHVANLLKHTFVAKDELIELLITCAIAQEHLLIVGPPGTAKSELIKRFALLCSSDGAEARDGRVSYFEYLLTRFTEPNEIFGPVNIAAFREGEGAQRSTEGMLPRAEIAFLDEVFKANSAILNALLTILNERLFYNGGQRDPVPLICAIGATNAVPDDVELAALYDRFLLRVWTDNVEESLFADLFQRGWKLECDRLSEGYELRLTNVTTTDSLRSLNAALAEVDLSTIAQPYREVIRRLRAEGVQVSDRRVIKLLKLIAASALRHKRDAANPGDFWVLCHVWNDAEQIPPLQTIVNPYVEAFEGDQWSAERSLDVIESDVQLLDAQRARLRTDTDYVDFLQQIEPLRRELLRHSAAGEKAPAEDRARRDHLLERLIAMIEEIMKLMEQNL
jgi:MoxR-like ATPase